MDDLDTIKGCVPNLEACGLGGDYERYNVDFAITPYGDPYDDGGCRIGPTSSEQALNY
jgi:hypothetical protein